MLILPGPAAHSTYRLTALRQQLQALCPDITEIQAQFLHYVAADALTAHQQAILERLLDYGEPLREGALDGWSLWVIPRLGTISPWSSKATEIAQRCGLSGVKRIERGVLYRLASAAPIDSSLAEQLVALLHDRMTEVVIWEPSAAERLFAEHEPRPLQRLSHPEGLTAALDKANQTLGLALSSAEIDYLAWQYQALGRAPTDAELMMFAQANSEHCRHKIFNAHWTIDGEPVARSLFDMIRQTYRAAPAGILSAYQDNAAVVQGWPGYRLRPDPPTAAYAEVSQELDLVMKVETHNHPTAISPFPGAATGAGGEIRDEAATGRGARSKAGLCGFTVSNLCLPTLPQPWEAHCDYPPRLESALTIMLEGPLGAAAFNNEFGRPNLAGYFRTYDQEVPGANGITRRGYHKPIMIAGGMGMIERDQVNKVRFVPGTVLVVLGGPAMLIGLGGGAASSTTSGHGDAELDFASVQRGNPEMQRRCQEVIDRCTALGPANPILSIHDVGAGGLANALPELVDDAERGAQLALRAIPNAEPGMSPLEIWCNEAQERYVLAVAPVHLANFEAICARERCPYAVLGEATAERQLTLDDALFNDRPVDLPMAVLLGKLPRLERQAHHQQFGGQPLALTAVDLTEAAIRVLNLPAVAAKTCLITIGDRSVSGLVARDQLVGPWQVPVADVAVTLTDYYSVTGEAMAMGERPPLALLDPAASARMAVAETLTNLAAADIDRLSDIRLSANWMAAAGEPGEDVALFDAVQALGEQFCPALGLAIPVGKDSLSMRTVWQAGEQPRQVTSPLSVIISGFAPVADARQTLTPQLRTDCGDTALVFIDLAGGRQRLGGSALAQVYNQLGEQPPDAAEPEVLADFWNGLRALKLAGLILAYHDRSDGGLLACACEMAFAGHVGVELVLDALGTDPLASLFNEELGVLVQVPRDGLAKIDQIFTDTRLASHVHCLGRLRTDDRVVFTLQGKPVIDQPRTALYRHWLATSYHLQALRDEPTCAREALETALSSDNKGLNPELTFDPQAPVAAPYIAKGAQPAVAILRDQGINGQTEMAAAFMAAGFQAVDVPMQDLVEGRRDLNEFNGLAACGGFSYGDVLGAGGGWAKSILYTPRLNAMFDRFFQRGDVFALGVCNGCQMLAQLRELIPGAASWPLFLRNRSEQFEARLSQVEILDSPSIFFQGMQGSRLPIAVAHGEGRADLAQASAEQLQQQGLACLRYVDGQGQTATRYPDNPNGSPLGLTGFTTANGRFTIMMPHPERVFRTLQFSWHPPNWQEGASPWLRLFTNARVRLG